jgi:hypothetical protein
MLLCIHLYRGSSEDKLTSFWLIGCGHHNAGHDTNLSQFLKNPHREFGSAKKSDAKW